MLLSSSEGFCLEGLVAAILLRAAMIAVVGLELFLWVGWVELVWEFTMAIGLSSRVKRQGRWPWHSAISPLTQLSYF